MLTHVYMYVFMVFVYTLVHCVSKSLYKSPMAGVHIIITERTLLKGESPALSELMFSPSCAQFTREMASDATRPAVWTGGDSGSQSTDQSRPHGPRG